MKISCSILASCAFCVLFASAAHAGSHQDAIIVLDEAAAAVILIPPLATTQTLLWSEPKRPPARCQLCLTRTLNSLEETHNLGALPGISSQGAFDPTKM